LAVRHQERSADLAGARGRESLGPGLRVGALGGAGLVLFYGGARWLVPARAPAVGPVRAGARAFRPGGGAPPPEIPWQAVLELAIAVAIVVLLLVALHFILERLRRREGWKEKADAAADGLTVGAPSAIARPDAGRR